MRILFLFLLPLVSAAGDLEALKAGRKARKAILKTQTRFQFTKYHSSFAIGIPDSLIKQSLKRNDLQLKRLSVLEKEGLMKREFFDRVKNEKYQEYIQKLNKLYEKLYKDAEKIGTRMSRDKEKLRKEADALYDKIEKADDPPKELVKKAKDISAKADAMLKAKLAFTKAFPENFGPMPIDKVPFDFKTPVLGGEDIILSDKVSGKLVIILWWSLKNKQSIEALEAFDAIAKKNKRMTFLAMNIGDSFEDISKHFKDRKWNLSIGRDTVFGDKGIHEYYNVFLLPSIVVIKYMTEDIFIGYTKKTARSLEKLMRDLK